MLNYVVDDGSDEGLPDEDVDTDHKDQEHDEDNKSNCDLVAKLVFNALSEGCHQCSEGIFDVDILHSI